MLVLYILKKFSFSIEPLNCANSKGERSELYYRFIRNTRQNTTYGSIWKAQFNSVRLVYVSSDDGSMSRNM
jgi:hypothetical protein